MTPPPHPTPSLLDSVDLRARLVSAGALTLAIAATNSLTAALGGCALIVPAALCSGISLRRILSGLKTVGVFLIFLWITLPLTYVGHEIEFLGVSVSMQGFRLALLISLKSCSILILFMTLIGRASFTALAEALRRLGVSPKLCWILLFSYRYLSDIRQEYLRLRRAAMLRGFAPGTTLRTYQVYANMLGMTLVRTWLRAQKINQAMLLRGFHGRLHSLDPAPVFRPGDLMFGSLTIAASIGLTLCT
jgi:cobalt/nickel transport system permease protein